MQPLTDPVLRPYTAAQITSLLTCRSVQVAPGLELLDNTDNLISDISDQLAPGSTVGRDNGATIHGTAKLNITAALAWGLQRVRPYMRLTDLDTGVTGRWNLGVYVMATPAAPIAETPATYQVTGSDKLYLLDGPVGDSYSVAAGANVLSAVSAAITAGASVPAAQISLDQAASSSVLPTASTWALSSSKVYTWLDVINGLLKTVNYQPLWCDWNGVYRSGPLILPADRAPEFSYDAGDGLASIVGRARTYTADLWQAPNWWRFIAQNWATTPVEGNGQYTVQNQGSGPSSQVAVGRTVRKVLYVQAADQTSLQALGDQQVAIDKTVVQTLAVTLSPMPAQWHLDVASYSDPALGSGLKVATQSWELDLFGADGKTIFQVIA